jgi:hypothetical protein
MSNLLKCLIEKEFKGKNIIITTEQDGSLTLICNKNAITTIIPGSKWSRVKSHIYDKLIKNCNKEDCVICCEKILTNVSCVKCYNSTCSECYINLFKVGQGLITCPYCKNTIGSKMPKHFVDLGVQEIRDKLSNKYS